MQAMCVWISFSFLCVSQRDIALRTGLVALLVAVDVQKERLRKVHPPDSYCGKEQLEKRREAE